MRRRPLLRGAAIAGGAYYAGKRRMQAGQRDRELQERTELLQRLVRMHEAGVLTDDEFATRREALGD